MLGKRTEDQRRRKRKWTLAQVLLDQGNPEPTIGTGTNKGSRGRANFMWD